VVSFCVNWRRFVALTSPRAIVAVAQHGSAWSLTQRNGTQLTARLCGDSVVTRGLLVLNFTLSGRRRHRSVVLCVDSVAPEQLRQLRVRLQHPQ